MPSATDRLTIVAGTLRACDALIVAAAGVAGYFLRHETFALPEVYLAALALGALLTANFFHVARLYLPMSARRPSGAIGRLTVAWFGVMASLIVFAYFARTSDLFSRVWVVLWFALSYAGFLGARLALELRILRWERDGSLSTRIAIVGGGPAAERLEAHFARMGTRFRVIGLFDDDRARLDSTAGHFAVRGSLDDLIALSQRERIDEAVLAMAWRNEDELLNALKRLRTLPGNVRLSPDAMGLPRLPSRGFGTLAGLPVLNLHERPLSGWGIVLKAIEDRMLAALLLLVLLPVMAAAAVAVKLSGSGSILFRQRRYGFNNNVITVYKFRTMREQASSDAEIPQATRDDPRITRVGAFMRRTSLDELPQLLNVLKGDMSLVGPRPHAVAHNVKYAAVIDDYLSRHRVKPGITGWAQVNGLRGETDTPEKMRARVEHDLYYIDNWSLIFDIRILILTIVYGFVHRNAY
ncbi:MAG: undecaprenyl-phosphate glucose phosphotransferase [Alphaproteobacteria bacterium]